MNNNKIQIPVVSIYESESIYKVNKDIEFVDTGNWLEVTKDYVVLSQERNEDDIVINEIEKKIKFHASFRKDSICNLHYFYDESTKNWDYNICSNTSTMTSVAFKTLEETKEFDKFIKSIL